MIIYFLQICTSYEVICEENFIVSRLANVDVKTYTADVFKIV